MHACCEGGWRLVVLGVLFLAIAAFCSAICSLVLGERDCGLPRRRQAFHRWDDELPIESLRVEIGNSIRELKTSSCDCYSFLLLIGRDVF